MIRDESASGETSDSCDGNEAEDLSPFPIDQTGIDEAKQANGEQQPTNMTKNQMKKLAKRQRMLELRPAKRKLEREKRRLKKQEAAQAERERHELSECQDISGFDKTRRTKLMSESLNKFKVIIDMDFGDLMTDDEIGKAAKQCKWVYAANRRSENPCQLYFTSVVGKIRDRFDLTCGGHQSWDANVTESNYIDALVAELTKEAESKQEILEQDLRAKVRENVIYLTGDTDELLPEVDDLLKDESKVFIIGGLVDHNRLKNLCYERAKELNIRTAKLPISQNLRLCQRHILSTVAVFEIMLNVLGDHKSWRDALLAAIPRRKIHASEFDENKT